MNGGGGGVVEGGTMGEEEADEGLEGGWGYGDIIGGFEANGVGAF